MTIDNDIKTYYFDWLYNLISPENDIGYFSHYVMLLQELNLFDYVPKDSMDNNRKKDGINLRHRFAEECNINISLIDEYINDRCSMLEMMVALAYRCEETIMYDYTKGNRTYIWFSEMLESLNLSEQTDEVGIDKEYIRHRISIFLNKQYDANGRGGLFTVTNSEVDMRDCDIWYQMQEYLKEYVRYENSKKIIISH